MIVIAVALLLVQVVCGQEMYRCDCALLADEQLGEDVTTPLWFDSVPNYVDPLACNDGPFFNPCAQYCNLLAVNLTADGGGLCVEMTDGPSNRCWGGIMCEIMFADDHENVNDEPLRMYFRVPDCPDYADWTVTGFQMDEDLCCDDGIYEPCDNDPCLCNRVSYNYCECGVFVPEQHDVLDGNKIPIPLQVVGQNSTDQPEDESFCDNQGIADDTCRQLCGVAGNATFNGARLNDYPEGYEQTFGELYCRSLFGRAEQYEDWEAIETRLGVWKRAPRCDDLEWDELPLVKHDEELCCDDDGHNLYPCPSNFHGKKIDWKW